MKLLMGHTKRGEQTHLVSPDDLAVGLCGVKITRLVRQIATKPGAAGALVFYGPHWENKATSGARWICLHCEAQS